MEASVRSLIDETDRYLAGLPGADAGIADVRGGIAAVRNTPVGAVTPSPQPICGCLSEALTRARQQGEDRLASAIEPMRPHFNWVTYDAYPRDLIGPRFPKAHAFATLIGGDGFVPARDFELGLFLIAPKTLYRDHRHPAPELYAPITGPHRWRFGVASPWRELPAHIPVWNEPNAVHATLVGDVPFLGFFAWTRDVNLPASVVPADDWSEIESRL